MKNRITVFVSLLLTAASYFIFDVLHTWWAWLIFALTLCAQLWILVKNKNNLPIRIGNYFIWLSLVVFAGGIFLARIWPDDPSGSAFGTGFAIGMGSIFIGLLLFIVSVVSYLIGAIIKSKVTSPNQ